MPTLAHTAAMMHTEVASERKERFAFYLDPEYRRELERRSEETGAPKAELVRRAIQAWLSPETRQSVKSTNVQDK